MRFDRIGTPHEQRAKILGVESGAECPFGVHDIREQCRLFRFECHDLLFDRVFGNETVDHDVSRLPDAVSAIDRLCFGGWVPPGIEDEAVVGLGEIETEATSLEADQKDGHCARLELLQDFTAIARRTVEVAVGDALCVESGAHRTEESGELTEDQRTVPAGDDVVQLLDESVDLGRRDGSVFLVDQRDVEAELA